MATVIQSSEGRPARGVWPFYLVLFPIPVVCFIAALITDITYTAGAYLMWLHFSQWLIAAGLLFGFLAALLLLFEFFTNDAIRAGRFGWTHLLLFYGSLLVGLFNAFVHTADGWTAVVPTGMLLSIVAAILAVAAVWALFFVPVRRFHLQGTRP